MILFLLLQFCLFWTVSVCRQGFSSKLPTGKREQAPVGKTKWELKKENYRFGLYFETLDFKETVCAFFFGTKDTAAELPTKTLVWWIYHAFSTRSHLLGIIIRSAAPNSANQTNPPKRMLNYHPLPFWYESHETRQMVDEHYY